MIVNRFYLLKSQLSERETKLLFYYFSPSRSLYFTRKLFVFMLVWCGYLNVRAFKLYSLLRNIHLSVAAETPIIEDTKLIP